MSRFALEVSRNTGTNDRDGTRAHERTTGTCPVPLSVPISPAGVPIAVLGFLARLATGWPLSSAWWVLRYELAEAATC